MILIINNKTMKKIIFLSFILLAFLLISGCGHQTETEEQPEPSEVISEERELDATTSDCQLACLNYVNKCLTLVPNATQALFDEGLVSCLTECIGWDNIKTACMIGSENCELMTDVCGL
jgi:hypothetical protein